jgi:hypothetical protein
MTGGATSCNEIKFGRLVDVSARERWNSGGHNMVVREVKARLEHQ